MLLAIAIRVIEISHPIEAAHMHSSSVPDAEVSMQSFFKDKLIGPAIRDPQFEMNRTPDGDAKYEAKVVRPPAAR